MKEEWLMPRAAIPVDIDTTLELVTETKRLMHIIGCLAMKQHRPWVGLTVQEVGELWDADGTGYIPQKQLQFYAGIWDKLKEKNQ